MILFNKKALVVNTMVLLILMLIGAGMLYGITHSITKILSIESEEKICAFSSIVAASTKVQGIELTKIDCPMQLKTVTETDVRREAPKVIGEIKEFKTKDEDRWNKLTNDYKKSFTQTSGAITDLNNLLQGPPYNSPIHKEFALHSLVGNELRKCWQKMGEGRLDLFSNWFSKEGVFDAALIQTGLKDMPSICIVCTRIKFDQEVKEEFGDRELSLEFWSQMTKPKNKQITYAEYLLDDSHDKDLFGPRWKYTVTEPIAAVYAKIPTAQLREWGTSISRAAATTTNFITNLIGDFDFTKLTPEEDKGVDLLYLVPLSEIKNICGYIANEAPTEVT